MDGNFLRGTTLQNLSSSIGSTLQKSNELNLPLSRNTSYFLTELVIPQILQHASNCANLGGIKMCL